MVQLGGVLGRLFGQLLKTDLSLIRNVLKPLAKRVLLPLRLIAAASAIDTAIQKKILGWWGMHPSDLAMRAILIISNEEIDYIMNFSKNPVYL